MPPAERRALQKLRAEIKAAAPQAEERLWYHIPSYVLNGPLLHFAAQPKHLALYAVPVRAFKEFRDELKPFKVSGRTIQFSAEHPLPASLVKKIVKMRVRDNSARRPRRPPRGGHA
ncbi:MAG: iron chaperone [Thermoplasmatota archaeon]